MKKCLTVFTLIISLVILLLTTIILPGCSCHFFPLGTGLTFEYVNDNNVVNDSGGTYPDKNAQIIVIDSLNTLPQGVLEWVWITSDKTAILAVDYSRYFVVMLFNGYRGGWSSPFEIQDSWRNYNKIIFLAHFDDSWHGGIFEPTSQYQIVKIKRTEIHTTGKVVFCLLDEERQERATVSYTITK